MEEIIEMLGEADPAQVVASLTAVIFFIVELVVCTKIDIFDREPRRLREAKEAGHVLVGTRIDSRTWTTEAHGDQKMGKEYWCSGTYEYDCNGEKRKKRVVFKTHWPPVQVDLYYRRTPRHVFTAGEVTEGSVLSVLLRIVVYILPVLVYCLVIQWMRSFSF